MSVFVEIELSQPAFKELKDRVDYLKSGDIDLLQNVAATESEICFPNSNLAITQKPNEQEGR